MAVPVVLRIEHVADELEHATRRDLDRIDQIEDADLLRKIDGAKPYGLHRACDHVQLGQDRPEAAIRLRSVEMKDRLRLVSGSLCTIQVVGGGPLRSRDRVVRGLAGVRSNAVDHVSLLPEPPSKLPQ